MVLIVEAEHDICRLLSLRQRGSRLHPPGLIEKDEALADRVPSELGPEVISRTELAVVAQLYGDTHDHGLIAVSRNPATARAKWGKKERIETAHLLKGGAARKGVNKVLTCGCCRPAAG
jgi:hypothetical protein